MKGEQRRQDFTFLAFGKLFSLWDMVRFFPIEFIIEMVNLENWLGAFERQGEESNGESLLSTEEIEQVRATLGVLQNHCDGLGMAKL